VSASGGIAAYKVTFTNTGQSNLTNPVMYDLLPAVGDTNATSLTPRGSQFGVSLTGVGPVPSGVTVWYSQSSNPCRPEVLASNPGCVNDWTTTPPNPLSSVKALKFVYTGTVVVPGGTGTHSFSVPFTVATPSNASGTAWNTIGTNAFAAGNLIGAAESSRTGLQALPSPTVTKVSTTPGYSKPGDSVGYTFTLTNNTSVQLTSVGVTDNLVSAPAGDTAPLVTCQSLSSPSGSCSGATTTLAPGQSATFTASYAVTQGDLDAGSITDNATATANPPSGGVLSNTSANVTVPGTQSPAVTIAKTAIVAPAADQNGVKVGDAISYTYAVKNVGNVTLKTVSVNDPSIGPVSCPVPPAPGLAVGASETCTAASTYAVTQTDVDRGHVNDTATAGCTDVSGHSCAPSAPSSVSVPAAAAKPSVSIQKIAHASNGDTTPISVGETISYTYLVTNTGNTTIATVSVNDPTEGSVTCPSPGPSGLAPGGSVTCTADHTHTVTQADVDTGNVSDTATAGCIDSQGTSCPQSQPSEVSVPSNPQPRVAIVKTATVAPAADQNAVAVGDQISYGYKVTNIGNVTLQSVSVSDPSAGSVSCPTPGAPGLAPGQSLTCSAASAYHVTQADVDAGKVVDTATAGCKDTKGNACPSSNPSTATVPATAPTPSVSIVKSATVSPSADKNGVKVGDQISYGYKVTNTGNTTLASVSVSDPSGGSVSCPALGSGGLAPGDSVTCTAANAHAVTQADVDSGAVTDTATASCSDLRGDACPRSGPSKVTVPAQSATPSVSLVKTAAANPSADQTAVKVGDEISYSYKVTNTGTVTLASVSVDDPSLGQVDCPQPPAPGLAPGAAVRCTGTMPHLVTQADIDAGHVDDTATAGCTDVQGNKCATSAPSSASVPATVANPSITIKKIADASTGDTTPISLNETIAYAYELTNTGNVTLSTIAVSDPTIGSVTCPSPTLAPGTAETCTADNPHTVDQTDLNNGSVSDTATVTCKDPSGQACAPQQSSVTVPGVRSPAVSIEKTATVDPGTDQLAISVGDKIGYSYTVTNIGNVTLQSVSVSDPTGGSVTCPAPAAPGLAPGDSLVCTADSSHTVTQSDVDSGGVSDTATAGCEDTNNNACSVSAPSSANVPSVPNPRVSITKQASVSPSSDQAAFKVGDKVGYSYSVTNSGNVTLATVSVADPTVGNVTCPTPPGGLVPGDSITCTADNAHTVSQADVDAGKIVDTATAGCTDTGSKSCPTSDPSTATVQAQPATPSVSIVKTATVSPAADQTNLGAGDKVSYSYKVTNTGDVTLQSVSVDDPSIGAVDCPTLAPPGLAPGSSVTCTAAAQQTATQHDVDNRGITDIATATCTDVQGDLCATSAPSKVTTPARPNPQVSIKKQATVIPSSDQNRAKVGDRIAYTYAVTNTGNVDLETVQVTDPTLGAVTCPVPAPPGLAPGQTETCTGDVQHIVNPQDASAGKVTDTATAAGTDTSGNTGPKSAPSSVTIAVAATPAAPKLEITKHVNHRTSYPGGRLTYTITVTNRGPGTATGVSVKDIPSIPMSVTRVSASRGHCRTKPTITCALGDIKQGGRVTITVIASAKQPGSEHNSATVTATNVPGSHRSVAAVSTHIVPKVTLRKTASVRSARAGQAVTYTLRVANSTAIAVKHVIVCDQLPGGLLYVGSTLRAHLQAGRYCWTFTRLAAHGARTAKITVNVAPSRHGGLTTNHATAQASGTSVARAKATIRVIPVRPVPCGSVSSTPGRAHVAC
jgi:uncharacterized repeat protein (TIGR01451 family)